MMLRIVYSIKLMEDPPVYDISTFDLNEYIYEESLPSYDLLFVMGRESCNINLSETRVNRINSTYSKVDIKSLDIKIPLIPKGAFKASKGIKGNSNIDYDSDEDEELLRQTTCMLTEAKLSDFKLHMVLGTGAFGKVILASNNNLEVYAMKRIRKDLILK